MIRKATIENKENIIKLWRNNADFLGKPYIGSLKEHILKGEVYIYQDAEAILGFVEFHKRRDGVTTVYAIATGQRGLGIGRALLDSLPLPIRLKVTKDNGNAIRFYSRYGFEKVAEENASTGRALYVYERHL